MTEEEFRTRVMCHRQLMMAIAMTVLCNRDDALDCLQETFVGLWKNRSRLSGIENIRQYCATSVRNNALRMLPQKPSCPLENAGEQFAEGDADSRLENQDDLKILASGLRKLPESQRQVVLMSAVSGLSAPEISCLTDFSPSNVRILLSRGRRSLREFFNRNR